MAAYSRGKIALKRSLDARIQSLKKQRMSPKAEAETMCRAGLDKDDLEVKFINSRIGYGVFAKESFAKGSFLTEYVGERISPKEADKRDKNRKIKQGYIFYFKWNGLKCIDATDTDRIGKYINDAEIGDILNNCVMKLVMVENQPRLCLFANRDILKGEELRYDYGESNLPWRQEQCDRIGSCVNETKSGEKNSNEENEASDLTQIQIHHGDEHNADVKRISNRKRADNGGNLMLKQNLL